MVGTLVNKKTKESKKASKTSSQDGEQALSDITSLPGGVAKDLVQFFKLFSDETRLRILHFLMQCEELNVRTMCQLLKQSQPAVSHHLALLRVAGLIESRRDGKHNYYHVLPSRLKQLMEMLFSVSPNTPGLIGFDSFVLSYKPVEQAD